tara:strand:- start:61 stop:1146 length:1086 start_codon:yes stop_codon:yes gene_type:complete
MNLFKTYSKFKDEQESLYLLGYFSDEITVPLIELSHTNNHNFSKISKRLSFLTTETFQNIVRHGHTEIENVKKIKFGMFSFSTTADSIILTTVNQITNIKARKLDLELKELNSLNSVELKSKYIDILTNSDRTENGGAGIGFISILRKTKGKIDYRIKKIDNNISNFLFQSNLLNQSNEKSKSTNFRAEEYYDFMNLNNYLLFRKGKFDHSTLLIMTSLLSIKLNLDTNTVQNKALFFTVRELIQNIYNHGFDDGSGHQGIFLVKKDDHKLTLSAGNFVLNTNVDKITETFNSVNQLDINAINDLLNKRLINSLVISDNEESCGIGLLKVKKLTDSHVNFEFDKVNDKLSYLSVTISNIHE